MARPLHPSAAAPPAADDQLDLAWRRSESCGLTPSTAWPGAPDPGASRSRRLDEAAAPVMDALDSVLEDTGATVLLAGRDGRVIRTATDRARVRRMLLRRGIDEGAVLSEDSVGNNGIGTALELRTGVFIHGEQHFAESLRDFVCYGHPIVDPLTRRLVGAVDLTGLDGDTSRLFAPFVRKVVADIEARYVDTARADDRELWHRFVERTRASDTATCAFGDEVVLASRRSLERLDAHDLATLRRLADRGEVGGSVELSVGVVGISARRVGRRGHLLDLSFPEAERATRPLPGPTGPTGPPPRPTRTARTHAVEGPAGSGRTTAALRLAGPDADHVRLAVADDPAHAWRDFVVPALRRSGGALVLDDVDLLDDADLRRLAARLGSAAADLVVVTTREGAGPAVAAVLEACGGRTALRPLHERGAEADGIVRAMVDELSADLGRPAPTVSPRFVEAVQALDLPNGLVSLRSILRECLERPSPTLGPDALPARARAGRPPRSGELARSEYDAVVAALAECGGVRSRAARRLGVSRTTLYARMREFGLS